MYFTNDKAYRMAFPRSVTDEFNYKSLTDHGGVFRGYDKPRTPVDEVYVRKNRATIGRCFSCSGFRGKVGFGWKTGLVTLKGMRCPRGHQLHQTTLALQTRFHYIEDDLAKRIAATAKRHADARFEYWNGDEDDPDREGKLSRANANAKATFKAIEDKVTQPLRTAIKKADEDRQDAYAKAQADRADEKREALLTEAARFLNDEAGLMTRSVFLDLMGKVYDDSGQDGTGDPADWPKADKPTYRR